MDSMSPTLVQELGAALREVRWRLRVSQRELAEQLGVSKTWVGRLESGEVSAALAAVSRLVADLGLQLALSVDDEVHAPRRAAARPADGARVSVLGDRNGGDAAGDEAGAGTSARASSRQPSRRVSRRRRWARRPTAPRHARAAGTRPPTRRRPPRSSGGGSGSRGSGCGTPPGGACRRTSSPSR